MYDGQIKSNEKATLCCVGGKVSINWSGQKYTHQYSVPAVGSRAASSSLAVSFLELMLMAKLQAVKIS